jgi:hypothetical protein
MVGTTGIEPVTPTMSTQCVDGNYSVIPKKRTSNVRKCSRSDHGNPGHFLGLEAPYAGTPNPEMRRGAVGRGTPQAKKLSSSFESDTTALDWQACRFRKAAEARG